MSVQAQTFKFQVQTFKTHTTYIHLFSYVFPDAFCVCNILTLSYICSYIFLYSLSGVYCTSHLSYSLWTAFGPLPLSEAIALNAASSNVTAADGLVKLKKVIVFLLIVYRPFLDGGAGCRMVGTGFRQTCQGSGAKQPVPVLSFIPRRVMWYIYDSLKDRKSVV